MAKKNAPQAPAPDSGAKTEEIDPTVEGTVPVDAIAPEPLPEGATPAADSAAAKPEELDPTVEGVVLVDLQSAGNDKPRLRPGQTVDACRVAPQPLPEGGRAQVCIVREAEWPKDRNVKLKVRKHLGGLKYLCDPA